MTLKSSIFKPDFTDSFAEEMFKNDGFFTLLGVFGDFDFTSSFLGLKNLNYGFLYIGDEQ